MVGEKAAARAYGYACTFLATVAENALTAEI